MRTYRTIWKIIGLFACVFALGACTPTYSKDTILKTISAQIKKDWDLEPAEIKLQDRHLGIMIKQDKMWGEDNKLIPAAYTLMMNVERTAERVLISSDAQVDVLSVLLSSEDSTKNLLHRRQFDEIRKKRAGAISWQDVFDKEEVEQVPCWEWPDFNEHVYHYADISIEDVLSHLENLVQTKIGIKPKAVYKEGTLAVLFRVPVMWADENQLDPTVQKMLYAALGIAETTALKMETKIDRVSATVSGSDSWKNVTYVEALENVRRLVREEITVDERKEDIAHVKTNFWEWHNIGTVALYSQEELLKRVKDTITLKLKLNGTISVVDDQLLIKLDSGKAIELNDKYIDTIRRTFERLEDDTLVSDVPLDKIYLSITDKTKTVCFSRLLASAKKYREGQLSKSTYDLSLSQGEGQTCF